MLGISTAVVELLTTVLYGRRRSQKANGEVKKCTSGVVVVLSVVVKAPTRTPPTTTVLVVGK